MLRRGVDSPVMAVACDDRWRSSAGAFAVISACYMPSQIKCFVAQVRSSRMLCVGTGSFAPATNIGHLQRSLSACASETTGISWSGPAFMPAFVQAEWRSFALRTSSIFKAAATRYSANKTAFHPLVLQIVLIIQLMLHMRWDPYIDRNLNAVELGLTVASLTLAQCGMVRPLSEIGICEVDDPTPGSIPCLPSWQIFSIADDVFGDEFKSDVDYTLCMHIVSAGQPRLAGTVIIELLRPVTKCALVCVPSNNFILRCSQLCRVLLGGRPRSCQ
jgi:hypothetical protein